MKSKVLVLMAAVGVVLASSTPLPVLALSSDGSTATTDTKTTITARLEERRKRLGITLTTAEAARLKERCVTAQTKLGAFSQQVSEYNQAFQMKYQAYTEGLQNVTIKLKAATKDTVELEAQSAAMGQKYQVYKAQYDQVIQTLDDTKSVDCKSNPIGFKGSLEDVRAQYALMLTDQKLLTTYVQETMLPTLKNMKSNG